MYAPGWGRFKRGGHKVAWSIRRGWFWRKAVAFFFFLFWKTTLDYSLGIRLVKRLSAIRSLERMKDVFQEGNRACSCKGTESTYTLILPWLDKHCWVLYKCEIINSLIARNRRVSGCKNNKHLKIFSAYSRVIGVEWMAFRWCFTIFIVNIISFVGWSRVRGKEGRLGAQHF